MTSTKGCLDKRPTDFYIVPPSESSIACSTLPPLNLKEPPPKVSVPVNPFFPLGGFCVPQRWSTPQRLQFFSTCDSGHRTWTFALGLISSQQTGHRALEEKSLTFGSESPGPAGDLCAAGAPAGDLWGYAAEPSGVWRPSLGNTGEATQQGEKGVH